MFPKLMAKKSILIDNLCYVLFIFTAQWWSAGSIISETRSSKNM